MTQGLVFAPLVAWWGVATLAALALVVTVFCAWRRLGGWALRGLALGFLTLALAGPQLREETRAYQDDIVLVLVDRSASQSLGARASQTTATLARVEQGLAALGGVQVEIREIRDSADNLGTAAMAVMREALAEVPRARVAGVILISDGRIHDLELRPDVPAPVHLLLTGEAKDWDRRLVVTAAPAFGIIGEELRLGLRVEDQGVVPAGVGGEVALTLRIDAGPAQAVRVPVGVDLELPVTLSHGGRNVIRFELPEAPGELTGKNNAALVQINGVRDRLRVLLVSGEPHAGERVWRNLLKSDANVDLVHFTILRPPEKQDNVPVEELSLIAFPTRELFIDKIDEFDLIIFDRYRMRGILPMSYMENVVRYIREGGTVLVAAGPEFGAVDSIYRSPLAEILPVAPTAQVIDGGFRPVVTDLGRRHPVTEGLEAFAPEGGWGRWLRILEVETLGGQTVMEGPDNRPLLVLDRVDEGRIAVLTSDHVWLWGRGFEGGGPQLELLRRLAHWMLKEPDLEEEALSAVVEGGQLIVTRRSVADTPPSALVITPPAGARQSVTMAPKGPGRFEARVPLEADGLYTLAQDGLERVVGVGPASSREYEEVLASGQALTAPAREGGAAYATLTRVEEGVPALRWSGEGRAVAGRGWIGLTPREAYTRLDLRQAPLLPSWAWMLVVGACAVAAWVFEGRRRARPPLA